MIVIIVIVNVIATIHKALTSKNQLPCCCMLKERLAGCTPLLCVNCILKLLTTCTC